MTSLQTKAHGERRKQEKHQGNLETVREAFPLPWGLSKSLLKYGVSCFNPQGFPAPCYLCRLFFSHPQAERKKTQAPALTQFGDFSQEFGDFVWDKLPPQLTPPYQKAKRSGEGAGVWMRSTILPRVDGPAQPSSVDYLMARFPSGLSWTR